MAIERNTNATFTGDYPILYPILGLVDEYTERAYPMISARDYSPNKIDLVTDRQFMDGALVLSRNDGKVTDTQFVETDNMTILLCTQIMANPAEQRTIISSIDGAPQAKGFRFSQQPTGKGAISVASGNPTGATSLEIGGITGGWTRFAIKITPTYIYGQRAGGTGYGPVNYQVSRGKSLLNTILGGQPAGGSTFPIDGKIGCVVIYNRDLTPAEINQELLVVQQVMKSKGIIVP